MTSWSCRASCPQPERQAGTGGQKTLHELGMRQLSQAILEDR